MTAPKRVDVPIEGAPYPVLVGTGWLDDLLDHVALPDGVGRVLVVSQEPVQEAGHLGPVVAAFEAAEVEVHRYDVPDGEAAKSAGVLRELWEACAEAPLGRRDLVVAVGGGVVGDLAGFAAATWNRGIGVLQVPTTLLAQVDAAIGGKTGINLPQGKNLVGAFHQPLAVACDVATLATVAPRIRVEGFGEVVKYGLIADPDLLALLEDRAEDVLAGDPELLEDIVLRSATVKARVVAADEREGGVRAHLNLGHTYGHAVESLTGYDEVLHGEAVAIGTVVALRLGVRLGRTPAALADRAEQLLDRLGLPTRGPVLDRAQVWTTIARDKKADAGGVRFVVLDDLAEPAVVTPERAEVDAVLDELGVIDEPVEEAAPADA
ncbi:3-dehydroquinate synthase [Egicoccus halophilus]|uniref:3-dehydroquinate synthase n=1 Tax=Egicoccus halophilus TaxID=1670830 RepID=A0A8J3A8W1_9ACTN|nr:3-dehydroquinate synthase [Egicoccus halophilus]GGI07379.1 3-dehydroquinate synthase [Egicoccus halophilus]